MSDRPRRVPPSVLFCPLGYGGGGGGEIQARLEAETMARRGARVGVVTTRGRIRVSGEFNGVHVRRLPGFPHTTFWGIALNTVVLFVYLLFALRRYKVVHVFNLDLRLLGIGAAAWFWRRPIFTQVMGGAATGEFHNRWHRLSGNRIVLASRAIQALSGEIEGLLLEAGVPKERIVRLGNGVDCDRYRPATPAEKRALRQKLGLPLDPPIVLFCGRFNRIKGLDYLSDAWTQLAPSKAVLLLLGDRVRTNPRPGSGYDLPTEFPTTTVITRDWTNEPEDYYRCADVFVLPSRSEGMSNALLEAMACGLPSVVTNVGAAESVIEEGVSGFIVPRGDAPAIAEALGKLIGDPVMRASMGEAAASSLRQHYSIDAVIDQIEAVYDAILAGRPAASAV